MDERNSLIIYEGEPKKKAKKNRVWTACLCSALAASILTAGASVGGMYYLMGNNSTQSTETTSSQPQTNVTMASNLSDNSDNVTAIASSNQKKELDVTEIAEKVGPSVVGVINKAKAQPRDVLQSVQRGAC